MKLYSPVQLKTWLTLSLLIFPYEFCVAKRRVLDRSVVTVNDDIILLSDIEAFRQKAKSKNFQELFGGVDPKKLENSDTIVQLLTEEKIIDQQVKKLELTASDADVDRHIRSILERNGITETQLKSRLKDLGTSFPEYRDGIKRQMERQNLVEREIKPMIEASDEDLRHYMASHGGTADLNHRYELSHILVTTKGKAGVARGEKILKEALAAPDNFSILAKEYSDDRATANSGGDLGMLSTEAMASEFRTAAKNTPAGKVFPKLIKTPGGLHIVKVVKSETVSFSDLPEDKKAALRNQLSGEELEKKMALWIQRKKSEAHIRLTSPEKDSKNGG